MLISGDEAVALAAYHAGVHLGTGYPGTPSTEILEAFDALGGRAQWAPNEKVALEVGIGASFGGASVLVTMKHVGVNVAADPLFTAAYTGVTGPLVLVSADDPGMASSQNEQDNRHYAEAAGIPVLEPASSQEAYDLMIRGLELSRQWKLPIMLRLTTRVCHSKTIVQPRTDLEAPPAPNFERDVPGRVMIPAYARPAHKRLREKLDQLRDWNETSELNEVTHGEKSLGIITSGISAAHVRDAAPTASILKLGMAYPMPIKLIEEFVSGVDRCVVIDEGENWLADRVRAAGIEVEGKPAMYRFGEMSVSRVKRILAGDTSPESAPPRGKPPALCNGCPHRVVFESFRDQDLIVAGDIGCYTLGVLPPFQAIDTCVCMGASIGVGLGLRHALPEDQARRVVSVIGDSTFAHSGITGLVEMVYNPPPTGHVVVIVDNGTTAMTGQQEHPGTGRTLDHGPTTRVSFEDLARSLGIPRVQVMDAAGDPEGFDKLLRDMLDSGEPAVIVTRRPCILAAGKIRQWEKAAEEERACREVAGSAE